MLSFLLPLTQIMCLLVAVYVCCFPFFYTYLIIFLLIVSRFIYFFAHIFTKDSVKPLYLIFSVIFTIIFFLLSQNFFLLNIYLFMEKIAKKVFKRNSTTISLFSSYIRFNHQISHRKVI